MYLQDIVTEGIEFASDSDAKEYTLRMAARFDEEVKRPVAKYV